MVKLIGSKNVPKITVKKTMEIEKTSLFFPAVQNQFIVNLTETLDYDHAEQEIKEISLIISMIMVNMIIILILINRRSRRSALTG